MTQDGEEMAGRWRGMLGRLDVRDALDQTCLNILSCFGDLVSKFLLTYHCELIDGDSGIFRSGEKRLL